MRPSTHRYWFATWLFWALACPALAQTPASGFSLNRFSPAPTTEDGLALTLPRTLGHLRPGFSLTLDYAHRPLVLAVHNGERRGSIVGHRLVSHANAALGLGERAEVFVYVPITFVQTGDDPSLGRLRFPDPSTGAFGDIAVGGTLRLIGSDTGVFQLGAIGQLTLPSGKQGGLSGDDGVGGGGGLTALFQGQTLALVLNAGGRYRPDADYGSAKVGSELTFGVGGHARFTDTLLGITELNGATTLRDSQAFTSRGTPLEWLTGLRWTTPIHVVLTGAVGAGVTRAVGVPDVRAVAGVGWPPVRRPTDEPDTDGDGIPDVKDRCPQDPEDFDGFQDEDGCPEDDNDKDGILDGVDACPMQPEDKDGFEDTDGCPETDNDGDGIPDLRDACPHKPEDKDGFQDEDGCPDADNDADGILDKLDHCPTEPEDKDNFQDEDGCPDKDNDKDGIPDVKDDCPRAPGPASNRGCPLAVRIEKNQIRLLQRVEFQTNRAVLRPKAKPILQEVAHVVLVNPQLKLIRVEGHTDHRASRAYNQKLSQHRAEAVVEFLVSAGVPNERLIAVGRGEDEPLVPDKGTRNMEINRRVEFHLVTPEDKAIQPPDKLPETVEHDREHKAGRKHHTRTKVRVNRPASGGQRATQGNPRKKPGGKAKPKPKTEKPAEKPKPNTQPGPQAPPASAEQPEGT